MQRQTDMLATLLRDLRSQGERLAKLTASIALIEERMRVSSEIQRRDIHGRLRDMSRELKSLAKRLDTQPIAFRQVMDTWWLRLAAIAALGLANIDLKEAIALVLQLK